MSESAIHVGSERGGVVVFATGGSGVTIDVLVFVRVCGGAEGDATEGSDGGLDAGMEGGVLGDSDGGFEGK